MQNTILDKFKLASFSSAIYHDQSFHLAEQEVLYAAVTVAKFVWVPICTQAAASKRNTQCGSAMTFSSDVTVMARNQHTNVQIRVKLKAGILISRFVIFAYLNTTFTPFNLGKCFLGVIFVFVFLLCITCPLVLVP